MRLLVRDPEKALLLFGRQDENKVKVPEILNRVLQILLACL